MRCACIAAHGSARAGRSTSPSAKRWSADRSTIDGIRRAARAARRRSRLRTCRSAGPGSPHRRRGSPTPSWRQVFVAQFARRTPSICSADALARRARARTTKRQLQLRMARDEPDQLGPGMATRAHQAEQSYLAAMLALSLLQAVAQNCFSRAGPLVVR